MITAKDHADILKVMELITTEFEVNKVVPINALFGCIGTAVALVSSDSVAIPPAFSDFSKEDFLHGILEIYIENAKKAGYKF